MRAIAYEWGDNRHPKYGSKHISPDDRGQEDIARALQAYAGGRDPYDAGQYYYPAGRLNDLVYPVGGGMEVSE